MDRASSAQKLERHLQGILVEEKHRQERKHRERQAQAETDTAESPEPQEPTATEKPDTETAIAPAHLAHARQPVQDQLYTSAPATAKAEPASLDGRQAVYRLADTAAAVLPKGVHQRLQPEDFYQTSQNAKIRAMVKEVVAKEGPVAVKLVAERVARAYGLKKIGNKINQRVRMLARDGFQRSSENGMVFLWPHGYSPAGWAGFRVNPKRFFKAAGAAAPANQFTG